MVEDSMKGELQLPEGVGLEVFPKKRPEKKQLFFGVDKKKSGCQKKGEICFLEIFVLSLLSF